MNKLTKSDVRSAMLRSMCYQWQSFNYETMQSPGFAQMIAPSIEKIYEGDDELISKKVEQYLSTFYNTENTMGQIIHGAVLALEESGVENITDSAVALRTGLMGPFAGLGDSLFKVSSKVIFGSLAGYMALEGSIVGLILCIILCLVCNVFIRYFFFMEGYKQGVSFITTKQDMVTGCGFVELGFILGLLDGILCKIGFSMLFMNVFRMGYIGLWWGVACSRILPGCICVGYYLSGRWKTRRLLADE